MKKKLVSIFLFVIFTVMQITGAVPAKAAESDLNVQVVIESHDKVLAQGISAKSDILEAAKDVMDKAGVPYKEENSSWGGKYISEISGVKAKKFSAGDGWMYAVNRSGEYVDTFAPDFSLKKGDRIIFYFGSWGTLANKIEFSTTKPNSKTSISIWNFDSFSNTKTPIKGIKAVIYNNENKVVYDRVIQENIIGLENGLNEGDYKLELSDFQPDSDPKVVFDSFSFTIKPDLQGGSTGNTGANNLYDRDNTKITKNIESEISAASNYIKSNNAGDPWAVLSLSKAGEAADDYYIKNSAQDIRKDNGVQNFSNTELEKLIIVLASSGYSPYSFMGHDLAAELFNRDIDSFLMNDVIYGLIAYNYANLSGDYKIKKEQLVDMILANKLSYNKDNAVISGWALTGNNVNPDMTGLALSALAPYNTNMKVKEAIESAVDSLSKLQSDSGYMADNFGYFSESLDMVIVGLTSVGVNPEGEKFAKAKGDLVSALLSFKGEEGQFRHSLEGKNDYIATEQALRALISLKGFKEKGSFNYYSSNIDSSKLKIFVLNENQSAQPAYLPQTGSTMDLFTLGAIGAVIFLLGMLMYCKGKEAKIK